MCPLTWHSAKDRFAECPLSQHSANNLFAFFLKMALPSAGSRALGKPDPALGKSSRTAKTYPNRPSLAHTPHSTQARPPVHRRPPACAAAACPPALPPPVPARPPPPSAVRLRRRRPYARTAAARPPVPPAAIALQPASPPPVRPRRGRPSGCPPPPRLRPPAPRSLRCLSPWPAHNHPPRRSTPADLDVEGSFDDAVAGCDYAFLVAAPMNVRTKDPQV